MKKNLNPIEIVDLLIAFALVSITTLSFTKLIEEVIKTMPVREKHRVFIILLWALIIGSLTVWFIYQRIKDNTLNPVLFVGSE